jgi:hypothetical protein
LDDLPSFTADKHPSPKPDNNSKKWKILADAPEIASPQIMQIIANE